MNTNNVNNESRKKNIILLYFEDDTIKPVIDIEEKYMKIIKKWYEDCNLILDIEKTDVLIPETIKVQDNSSVLFNEIKYSSKDEYLHQYLPLIINNTISNKKIKEFERKCFLKSQNNLSSSSNFLNQTEPTIYPPIAIYENLGIKIPENLLDDDTSDKKDTCRKIYPEIIRTVDPHILIDKNSYGKVVPDNYENIEIEPYNKIYEHTKLIQNDNDPNKIIFCYNKDCNILNPNFGDNSYITHDLYTTENKKSNKCFESIYIIYNPKFLQTLCIVNPSSYIPYILKNHTEFGFIKLFSLATNNKYILQFVKNEFDKIQFNDVDEVNQKLSITSQYIDFSNKQNNINMNNINEEIEVKNFIKSSFLISNDINNKISAFTLYDIIIKSKIVKIEQSKTNGFKNRLSKYLKDLGFEKKRYDDGYYYHGISSKMTIFNKPIEQIDIDNYIKERKSPLELLHEGRIEWDEKKENEFI
jgi:hypothetical protein